MKEEELSGYLKRGVFPLPEETEEVFVERARRFPVFALAEEQLEAGKITASFFGFSAEWMAVVYSAKNLPFWEGAATWIDPQAFPYIQLRPEFQKGAYLGLRRDEVLAHEAVHAVRMHYNEPVFEEILAYQTSRHRWRRIIGPFFRYPAESLLFLIALGIGVFCAVIGILFVLLIPALMALYFSIRLVWNQSIFRRAQKKYPLSVLVWMTDVEIRQAAEGRCGIKPETLRGQALSVLKPFFS